MATPDQAIVLPAPPRPPADGVWTREYGNELNRWLENLQRVVTGVVYLRANGLFLATTFPTTGYGLRAGEVFANDGVLTMVREDDIWLGAFAVTAELGTLTVTT